jgi:hypothetical protein
MNKLPIRAFIIFATLAATGVVLASISGNIFYGFQQLVMLNIGSALFAGSLAFFLLEMFRWDRERNASK